jgi:8-oxo-dGTP pyrophosphatase MutT (NUDIX family)
MSTTSQVSTPRIGARVLLVDQHDRVLLIHARDPDDPDHHWWELPGGGLDENESPEQAAQREVTEETGIELDQLGPQVWIRESRFRYRGRDHHRVDHVFLATCTHPVPTTATTFTENEKAGLIERTWFTATELHRCPDKLLPAELPTLLDAILAGDVPEQPLHLSS